MANKYILDKGEPVLTTDLMLWAKWFERSDLERIVADTDVGKYRVVTIFTALDYRFNDDEGLDPLLWETMIWPNVHNVDIAHRYTSVEAAREGHEKWIELACRLAGIDPKQFNTRKPKK